MNGHKSSTRTPETPILSKEALASIRIIPRSGSIIKSPDVEPYLAAIISGSKPGKVSLRKLIEEHRKAKPGIS